MHQRAEDILISPGERAWAPIGGGVYFKLLRYSPESGFYTLLLRMDKGSVFKSHYHQGAAETLVLKGAITYAGKLARAGDYIYEAHQARHDATEAVEDAELFYVGYGPVCFTDSGGKVEMLLDGEMLEAMSAGAAGGEAFVQAA